jgi:hypothetical protein
MASSLLCGIKYGARDIEERARAIITRATVGYVGTILATREVWHGVCFARIVDSKMLHYNERALSGPGMKIAL